MKISAKEKLALAEKLKEYTLAEVDTMLQYVNVAGLNQLVLDRIFYLFIELDNRISTLYDIITPEEWNSVVTSYATPLEDDSLVSLKEDVRLYTQAFRKFITHLASLDFENIIYFFEKYVLVSRCRHTQFIIFTLCQQNPPLLFGYLISQIKSKIGNRLSLNYITYFVSLLVRCKMEDSNFNLCIRHVLNITSKIKSNTNALFILCAQSLIYICCFHPRIHTEMIGDISVKDFITELFRKDVVGLMNPNVINQYCGLYNIEYGNAFIKYDCDLLYFFPFDPPVIDSIKNIYKNSYVEFRRQE
ncbi:hypothetical protein TCON_0942 [Astathelohania contejeani]|uniref:CCAAT-binding factor domain-containing protein n=1 Tax=Astathelohania contejeani TaxID=164912 RepID=A0ABQ7I0C7_9MICR|nr:hypothetical protein TCON_0942 [Thelohania contejeani]